MRLILNFTDNVSTFVDRSCSVEKRQTSTSLMTMALQLHRKGWFKHVEIRKGADGIEVLDRVIMVNPITVIGA